MVPARLDDVGDAGQAHRLVPHVRARVEVEIEAGDGPTVRDRRAGRGIHPGEWLAPVPAQGRVDGCCVGHGEIAKGDDDCGEVAGEGVPWRGTILRYVGHLAVEPPDDGPSLRIAEAGLAHVQDLGDGHGQRVRDVRQPAPLLLDGAGAARLTRQPHQQVVAEPEECVGRAGRAEAAQRQHVVRRRPGREQRADEGFVDPELVVVQLAGHASTEAHPATRCRVAAR